MITRSLRFRLAAFTSIGVAAVFCCFTAFLYTQIRVNMTRDIALMVESKARVLANTRHARPTPWIEVETLLLQSGGDMALFVWRDKPGLAFISSTWPASLDPREVAPALRLPDDWRNRRAAPDTVLNPDSRPLDSSAPPAQSADGTPTPPPGWRVLPSIALPASDPARRYGAYAVDDMTIIMGTDHRFLTDRLNAFRNLLLAGLVPALLLSFALGSAVASRSLGSLNAIVRAVERVTARGLDQRLRPEHSDREFGRLISVFNEMLERLERSFKESRRFTDAAAHELRSPLTVLQGKLDEAMRSEAVGSERQQTLAILLEEVARLKGITDRLLLLARSDAGRLELYKETVDLGPMIENLVEDARLLAPSVDFQYQSNTCLLECDRALVMQVIHNLLSNAAKYNLASGGFVRVELETKIEEIEVRVINSGPPIPSGDVEKIFDRFFRVDESRSRQVEGSGLGLSLAREIAHAHGGRLVLVRSDGRETRFALTLPVSLSTRG